MNRLNDSSSLYLRQHADNPVHWQPWDATALAQARDEGRPILLSIGYSACHWCHVMAHESFEDPDTAAVMNEHYVNIKVDREERPDLDKVYQLSHQLLTGRGGGWPLTVFLDPEDLGAFFAGTYFPPQPRHGLPAFVELLQKVRQWFDANRGAVTAQNRKLQEAIERTQSTVPGDRGDPAEVLAQAFGQLRQRYDPEHGGFGGPPKFPQAPLLTLAAGLAHSGREYANEASEMLDHSLAAMAASGLRDHLDGGFFRYTVDGSWTIPHFEKMLYDNAQLLPLYAEAAAGSGSTLHEQAARGIVHWLLTEMRLPDGGFSASIDADADGQEGGFHVWGRDEISELLGADDYETFAAAFGLDLPPNFEGRHWHLLRTDGAIDGHQSALAKLHETRERRVPPATDTKLLTAWNALCIDGLARAGVALDEPGWIDAAAETLDLLLNVARHDGRLYAVVHDGEAQFPAYLDDHAFLLQAVLSLLRARWQDGYLNFARQLADDLLERFADPGGGFWFTAKDQDTPVTRLRIMQDDATPSGNAIAAMALETLAHLEGEERYLQASRAVVDAGLADAARYPLAHASLLLALKQQQAPPAQVIILGEEGPKKELLIQQARRSDQVHCYVVPARATDRPALITQEQAAGGAAAWVCHGMRCLPPAATPAELERALRKT